MPATETAFAVPNTFAPSLVWKDPETGNLWLHFHMVDRDYAEFRSYPEVLSFKGQNFVKRGWNSDTGVITYRNNIEVASPPQWRPHDRIVCSNTYVK